MATATTTRAPKAARTHATPAVTPSTSATLQARFNEARKRITSALIERHEEVDLILAALVAGEHVLLVGAPGAAKSMLMETITDWLDGTCFTYLMTKFTTPEEVFGQIDIGRLRTRNEYVRITKGKLPEADLGFADEIFKASSAILNTYLRILNERRFDPGTGDVTVPLQMLMGASNEWPNAENGGKELGALFDRFLLRKQVRYIGTRSGRERLLWDADLTPKLDDIRVTVADLEVARAAAATLAWTDEAKTALNEILDLLAKDGIRPSDRRLRKSVKAVQAYAWTHGATQVEPDHLEVLAAILWDDPETQMKKAHEIIAKVANPTGMAINAAVMAVDEILATTDLKNLSQAATATTKLQDVRKRLAKMTAAGNGRVQSALEYVDQQIKAIKKSAMESL
jgi:MoxR-like ATPase